MHGCDIRRQIFGKTVKYSVMLLGSTIVFIRLQAFVIPGVVPQNVVAVMP